MIMPPPSVSICLIYEIIIFIIEIYTIATVIIIIVIVTSLYAFSLLKYWLISSY